MGKAQKKVPHRILSGRKGYGAGNRNFIKNILIFCRG